MVDVSSQFGIGITAQEFRQKASTELSALLGRRGWELKQSDEDSLVWERRYWPPPGWLGFLVVFFGGAALFGDSTNFDGSSNGFIWFVLVLWIGLLVGCALIRQTMTLYLRIESQEQQTVVSFGGRADQRTAKALDELAEGMPSVPS